MHTPTKELTHMRSISKTITLQIWRLLMAAMMMVAASAIAATATISDGGPKENQTNNHTDEPCGREFIYCAWQFPLPNCSSLMGPGWHVQFGLVTGWGCNIDDVVDSCYNGGGTAWSFDYPYNPPGRFMSCCYPPEIPQC